MKKIVDVVEIVKLAGEGMSTRGIASSVGVSQTQVRRLLQGAGSATKYQIWNQREQRCVKCGEENPLMFYGNDKSYCKRCHGVYYTEKNRKQKARAVAELGGKCKFCGYDKHFCSLDFHHIDQKKKDVNFGSKGGWSWDRLMRELRKCVLLCKNCHAAVHTGEIAL
jgi:hypothetical protein